MTSKSVVVKNFYDRDQQDDVSSQRNGTSTVEKKRERNTKI